MPKGMSSTLLRAFKTLAVLEATCKAPRYLENMAKHRVFVVVLVVVIVVVVK